MSDHLVAPHGGSLTELLVSGERAAELKEASPRWPSWDLGPRQLCDLELLLNGGCSPLRGFLGRDDYESVCDQLRLTDGTLWPVPLTLGTTEEFARTIGPGATVALRDPEGIMLAALHVAEVFRPDRRAEARLGTARIDQRGVGRHLEDRHPVCLSGRLEGVQLPVHYDFRGLRFTPRHLRTEFSRLGWRKVVAFQPRGLLHRAEVELTLRAAREAEANLLLQPVVGRTSPDDLDHYTRVRCYQAVLSRYPRHAVMLALLPLAERLPGPHEALWRAIIGKNFGCSHIIVDGDPAGLDHDPMEETGTEADGQALVRQHEEELGLTMVPFRPMEYVEDLDAYVVRDEVPEASRSLRLSGNELHRRLSRGLEIPDWCSFPEVVAELRRAHPPISRQGFTVFFTGLSGSGKSTIANALLVKLLEMGGRPVTLLDGDIVRKHLSSELGFSKEHRDINIRRIGFVASEITKNGGIALCAPIAPYDAVRREVRDMIQPLGGFVLVHVSTPLEACEGRDRKGLYAKARAGLIKEFTGISDPYEEPGDADVRIDTTNVSPEEAAQEVLLHLEHIGFISGPA